MKKLGAYGNHDIDVRGCAFLTDLKCGADYAGRDILPQWVNVAYTWVVPQFMRKDCYIEEHTMILRVGVVMGGGDVQTPIKYLYRADRGKLIIHGGELEDCNFFMAGVPYPHDPDGRHFYQSDKDGNVVWNPGKWTGEAVSIRGYKIG